MIRADALEMLLKTAVQAKSAELIQTAEPPHFYVLRGVAADGATTFNKMKTEAPLWNAKFFDFDSLINTVNRFAKQVDAGGNRDAIGSDEEQTAFLEHTGIYRGTP